MMKTVFTIIFVTAVYTGYAQVKIGYNSGTVNQGAVLELSNNPAASPTTWKEFFTPYEGHVHLPMWFLQVILCGDCPVRLLREQLYPI